VAFEINSHRNETATIGTKTLNNRHKKLTEKYLQKSLQNIKLVIDLYNENKQFPKDRNITEPKSSMFNIA